MTENAPTLIALAATIVTTVATISTTFIRARTRERLAAIENAGPQGAAIVADAVRMFDIPTDKLTKDQVARIVHDEILSRDRKHKRAFTFLLVLVLALAATTVVLAWVSRPAIVGSSSFSDATKQSYIPFDSELQKYVLVARNVRDVFGNAGALALEPDEQTDQAITAAFEQYNKTYEAMRLNHQSYMDPAITALTGRLDLQQAVRDAMNFALEHVHQQGILRFNSIWAHAGKIKELRAKPGNDLAIETEKIAGKNELLGYLGKIDGDLRSLEEQLRTLRMNILGHD